MGIKPVYHKTWMGYDWLWDSQSSVYCFILTRSSHLQALNVTYGEQPYPIILARSWPLLHVWHNQSAQVVIILIIWIMYSDHILGVQCKCFKVGSKHNRQGKTKSLIHFLTDILQLTPLQPTPPSSGWQTTWPPHLFPPCSLEAGDTAPAGQNAYKSHQKTS